MSRFLLLILAVITSALIGAPGRADATAVGLNEAIGAMRAGDYWWMPEVAPKGQVMLVISRPAQRVGVYRNGLPIAFSTVSTGRPGYRTPTGTFAILQKRVEHYSSIYDNAPMPYMQRLTWGGVALHAGTLPGYPASHGCIRLPHEFARLLYGVTGIGTPVVVNDEQRLPVIAPLADDDLALLRGPPGWWPERAAEGPVAVVVGAADRRIAVLRGGRLIGAAAATVARPIAGTTALALRMREDRTSWWAPIGLPSPLTGSAGWIDIEVDAAFRRALSAILHPGATAMITAEPLGLAQTATASAAWQSPLPRCA